MGEKTSVSILTVASLKPTAHYLFLSKKARFSVTSGSIVRKFIQFLRNKVSGVLLALNSLYLPLSSTTFFKTEIGFFKPNSGGAQILIGAHAGWL
jgi:hypothetical protein